MVIEESILYSVGASLESYNIGDFIFSEGGLPKYYYQIYEGRIKLNNFSEKGKENIQNILEKGESVGESLLFIDRNYPINAIAITPCKVLRLTKRQFFSLLKKYPQICIDMNKNIAKALYFKLIMNQNNSSQDPVVKIKTLLDYLKSFQSVKTPFSFQIPLTRQQMASLTGLRVETTIRTLKIMEKEDLVRIHNRKILY